MNCKELNIWSASVFDFTDNAEILQHVIGEWHNSKSNYLKACNFLCRMQHIEEYASLVGDARLKALATAATAKAWNEWDKMADEAQRQGLIID